MERSKDLERESNSTLADLNIQLLPPLLPLSLPALHLLLIPALSPHPLSPPLSLPPPPPPTADPYKKRSSMNRPVLRLQVKPETLQRQGIATSNGVSAVQRSTLRQLAHAGVYGKGHGCVCACTCMLWYTDTQKLNAHNMIVHLM